MARREPKLILCPYCGAAQARRGTDDEVAGRCVVCGGLFEPLSRRATQIAMGPWFIRDKRNPFRPGCSFEVLKRQIEAGRIKPATVVRGPSTRQFWSLARNVPGVAHLLGYCHRCGSHVKPTDVGCPECAEPLVEPGERNELGLLFPTRAAAEAAQRALDEALQSAGGGTPANIARGATSSSDTATGTTVTTLSADTQAINTPQRTLRMPPARRGEPEDDLLSEVFAESDDAKEKSPDIRGTGVRPLSRPLQSARALDFAPASTPGMDESRDDDALAVGFARRGPLAGSPLVWALLAANVVVLIALVALAIVFATHSRSDSGLTTPPPASAPPPAAPVASPPAGTTATAPAPPESDAAQAATTTPLTLPQIPQAVVTALEHVDRLEREGKPIEALNYMEQIKAQTTPQQRPRDFDRHLQSLRNLVDNPPAHPPSSSPPPAK